jgi:carbon monoxide dehydrogenase subunit G
VDFEGESTLDHLSVEDAWLILADPVSIQQTIPGCKLITKIDPETVDFEELGNMADDHVVEADPLPEDDHETVENRALEPGETYGVYMEIGVAGLNLSVGAFIYVDEREFPRMKASGEGIIGDYSFEMDTGIEVSERNGQTVVKWWLQPDISGSLFKWGSKLANPIFKRVVNRFFNRIEEIFDENR